MECPLSFSARGHRDALDLEARVLLLVINWQGQSDINKQIWGDAHYLVSEASAVSTSCEKSL
jgi:hypothetical protein